MNDNWQIQKYFSNRNCWEVKFRAIIVPVGWSDRHDVLYDLKWFQNCDILSGMINGLKQETYTIADGFDSESDWETKSF